MAWRSVRVQLPVSGTSSWVLVDDGFEMHPECRSFVMWLLARSASTETIRAYVPRIGRYLNWCEGAGVAWRDVRLNDLARFKFLLEQTMTAGGQRLAGKSVNAVLIAVVTFLRFCAAHGLIDAQSVERLQERRFLHHVPEYYNRGENGQFSVVRSSVLRAPEISRPPETLTSEETSALLGAVRSARDRFLVTLLLESGVRIGEALGLRREDLHLLPSSAALGCQVAGAHLHVRPRLDNVNGARVKSGRPRVVPLSEGLIEVYRHYVAERELDPAAAGVDYVFLNRHGPARGRPMSYSNAKQMIEAAGRRAGVRARPHMLRHTAATRWRRSGAGLDVVQTLLGHASVASTAIYLHATDEDLRAAVERVQ